MKFGLRDLRRLKEVDPIEIKPITLLVGRNSGGKSTYLRSLALLRQSILTRTSSPILWFGDLVDFGSFDESLSRGSDSGSIGFTVFADEVRLDSRQQHYYYEDRVIAGPTRRSNLALHNVSYSTDIVKWQEKNRVARIIITTTGELKSLELFINEQGIVNELKVNGVTQGEATYFQKLSLISPTFLPTFRVAAPRNTEDLNPPWYDYPGGHLVPVLFKWLREKMDGRIRDRTLQNLAFRLIATTVPSPARLKSTFTSEADTVKKKLNDIIDSRSDEYKQLVNIITVANVPAIMRSLGTHFRSILASFLYIGPARARSERYYRYQDLAVNEIDPDGKNFPILLNSLPKGRQDAFSAWVEKFFGYGVSVTQRSGHISINLRTGDDSTNIIDAGYGVSQVLPVMGQIWWARQNGLQSRATEGTSILAIEQPELHLHPAHQALLADVLVEEAARRNDGDRRIRYIIETHSETLINRIGEFVALKKLKAEDVQVVLFEAGSDKSSTNVRTVSYDDDGVLKNWPFGFFQPDEI